MAVTVGSGGDGDGSGSDGDGSDGGDTGVSSMSIDVCCCELCNP